MAGMNMAVLMGHAGRDPEITALTSGGSIARFSLATSETWRDKASGERKERTEWHNVVVFNEGLVGVVEKYVKKGSQLMVRGAIRTRKWQDKDGKDRWSTEIHLSGFDASLVLCGKGDGSGRPPPPDDDPRAQRGGDQGDLPLTGGSKQGRPAPGDGDFDDEIPF